MATQGAVKPTPPPSLRVRDGVNPVVYRPATSTVSTAGSKKK